MPAINADNIIDDLKRSATELLQGATDALHDLAVKLASMKPQIQAAIESGDRDAASALAFTLRTWARNEAVEQIRKAEAALWHGFDVALNVAITALAAV